MVALLESLLMRIGAVSYLNTKPLIYGIANRLPDARLELDLPSRLADRLIAGDLDVALIPAVEYLRGDQLALVSNACIACRGPVRSVRLLFRTAPSAVRTLALDEGSRTSVALARILLRKKFALTPELRELPVQQDYTTADADAILVIGDRAMHLPDGQWHEVWDLGEQWYSMTGLPFVFAMWVGRWHTPPEHLVESLEACRDAGLRDAAAIAESEAPRYGLSPHDCLQYFTEQLHFTLGTSELAGLELFYRWAVDMSILPTPTSSPLLNVR